VTTHGLACQACLTDRDFARYPGWTDELGKKHPSWKEQMGKTEQRRQQAAKNFNLEGANG